MPNLTPNYNLKKPLGTESALISVINENFDIIDDAMVPNVDASIAPQAETAGNKTKIKTILGWLANLIKAITGKTNWYTAPATNLEAVAGHMGAGGTTHPEATTSQAGFLSAADKQRLNNATTAATANTIAQRDSVGRLRVANPSNGADAATKSYVDQSIVFGTYTGDGAATRHISIGFTPRCVILMDMYGNINDDVHGYYFGGIAMPEHNCVLQGADVQYVSTFNENYCVFGISAGGFDVVYKSSSSRKIYSNMNGRLFYYIAFR